MNRLWIGAEAGPLLIRHRRLKLFKKAIIGGVSVAADRDPAQLEIPQQLKELSADVMGSRFSANPQSGFSVL